MALQIGLRVTRCAYSSTRGPWGQWTRVYQTRAAEAARQQNESSIETFSCWDPRKPNQDIRTGTPRGRHDTHPNTSVDLEDIPNSSVHNKLQFVRSSTTNFHFIVFFRIALINIFCGLRRETSPVPHVPHGTEPPRYPNVFLLLKHKSPSEYPQTGRNCCTAVAVSDN